MSSRIPRATSLSVRSATFPETAISMTLWRKDIFETIGASVSTGNDAMPSTRLLISLRACASSEPTNSCAWTEQAPSEAVEKIFSMFSTPSIASSMRTQTPSSASSGAAPR